MTIDGTPWVASTGKITLPDPLTARPGSIQIVGDQRDTAGDDIGLTIALAHLTGAGTYPLSAAGNTARVDDVTSISWDTWVAFDDGTDGALTLATLDGARATGTFQFTAPPESGKTTTTTIAVTDGAFDLPLPSGFMSVPFDQRASSVSATIDGQPWNAGQIQVSAPASGLFSVQAITDFAQANQMTLSLQAFAALAPGNTYDSSSVLISAAAGGSLQNWSGMGVPSSVTIATLTATRVSGTFTATLAPGTGATVPLTITGGAFDLALP
jgi:hypothetical protein